MSTSLVLTCPVHGADIEPFDIAGTKFCALCLRDFLAKTNLVRELKMTEVAVDRRERASEILAMRSITCDHCGTTWRFEKGTACPKCGKQAGGDDA